MDSATRCLFLTNVFIEDWFSSRRVEVVESLGTGQRELWLDIASAACVTDTTPPMECEICQRRLYVAMAALKDRQTPHRVEGAPSRFIVFAYPQEAEINASRILLFLAEMFVGWNFRYTH